MKQSVVKGKGISTQPSQGRVEAVIKPVHPLGQRGEYRGAM